MNTETNYVITYKGNAIPMFSDERADYVSLTHIANAHNRSRKSVHSWLKTNSTLAFLDAWEKKHNANYDATQLRRAYEIGRQRNGLSVKEWSELTGAVGIFSRADGTYAHKDIAIRFAAWINPEI
ncbi:MAG TPA: KilA-N domain-containing protein, partial [Segetibacter sp.]